MQWRTFFRFALTDWRSLWVLLAAATSGCAYKEQYPETWAPIANDPALCANVSGEYTPFDYRSRFVISWMAGNGNPKPPAKVIAADKLDVRIRDETLTAAAYLDGKIIAKKQYNVHCGGASIVLDLGKSLVSGQGVVGYSSDLLRLRKDSTDSLVVALESSGAGAFGPIPFAGSSAVWVGRFLPYQPGAVIPQDHPQPPPSCEYNVSQIWVDTREKAEKVEKALAQGESFDELAATDNRFLMRLTKGRMGWVHPEWYPTFKETIVRLKNGEYSRLPIEDKEGWHIIKVNGVRPDGCTPVMAP